MKVGDNLLCRKNYFVKDDIIFQKGERYKLLAINYYEFHNTLIDSYYVFKEKENINNILNSEEVLNIFFTKSQERKIKLNKLNETNL